MKKYEAVIILNPNLSTKVEDFVKDFQKLLKNNSFNIQKKEDVGRRQLAYPINKIHKAHYILMNIECGKDVIDELSSNFKFNDAVIRNMILKRKSAVSEKSSILLDDEEGDKNSNGVEIDSIEGNYVEDGVENV